MKLDARLEAPKLRRSPGAANLPVGTRNMFHPRYRSDWSETDALGCTLLPKKNEHGAAATARRSLLYVSDARYFDNSASTNAGAESLIVGRFRRAASTFAISMSAISSAGSSPARANSNPF